MLVGGVIGFTMNGPIAVYVVMFTLLLLKGISCSRLDISLLPSLGGPHLFVRLGMKRHPPRRVRGRFIGGVRSVTVQRDSIARISSIVGTKATQVAMRCA